MAAYRVNFHRRPLFGLVSGLLLCLLVNSSFAQDRSLLTPLWPVDLDKPNLEGEVPTAVAPAVGPDGSVYVTSKIETSEPGVYTVRLNAFSANGSDRSEPWPFEQTVQSGPAGFFDVTVASPVVMDDGTILFIAGERLYAVTPGGEERWVFEAASRLYDSPALGPDGTVYLGTGDGRLVALSQEKGNVLWPVRVAKPIRRPPVVGPDGTVYGLDSAANLYAISRAGAELWPQPTAIGGGFDGLVRPLLLGAEGMIYVVSQSLVAVHPDGSIAWRSIGPANNRGGSSPAPSPVVGLFRAKSKEDPSDWLVNLVDPDYRSASWEYWLADMTTSVGERTCTDSGGASVKVPGPGANCRVRNETEFLMHGTPAISPTANPPQDSGIGIPGGDFCRVPEDRNTSGAILYLPSGITRTQSIFYALRNIKGQYCVLDSYSLDTPIADGSFGSVTVAPDGRIYVVATTGSGASRSTSLLAFKGEKPRALESERLAPPWPMLQHDARHTGMSTTEAPLVSVFSEETATGVAELTWVTKEVRPTWRWQPTALGGQTNRYRLRLNGGEAFKTVAGVFSFQPDKPLTDGGHLLSVQEERPGGWSNPGTYSILVDNVPPRTTAALTTDANGKTITLTCIDEADASCDIFYDLGDGNGKQPYTGPITIGLTTQLTFWSKDSAGNVEKKRQIEQGKLPTRLRLDLVDQAVRQGERIDVPGKLTALLQVEDLSGLPIEIRITPPGGGTLSPIPIVYTDKAAGQFILPKEEMPPLTAEGEYTIRAKFSGRGLLEGSESSPARVFVGQTAGYAVIVQGKLGDSVNDRKSHAKTTDRIYRALLGRGFRRAQIHYYRYPGKRFAPGITDRGPPIKEKIEESINTFARAIKRTPAPFYLIMVNHGSTEVFHLDNGVSVTPSDLNQWLRDLEDDSGAATHRKPRVVIMGSCYSGSFIPALSGEGRVVVTSATEDEVSYKGARENDGIRVGEFFLEELFREWGAGETLKNAFTAATEQTRIFTRRSDGVGNDNRFGDRSVQHPLLDDDGNEKGSNALSLGADGSLAEKLFLGIPPDGVTNSAVSEVITEVTPTLYLKPSQRVATLRLRANERRILNPWVEIRPPGVRLDPDARSDVQIEFTPKERVKKAMKDAGKDAWQVDYPGFGKAGRYEVFYYARLDEETQLDDEDKKPLAPSRRSIVYKDKAGNTGPPTKVRLLQPKNEAQEAFVVVFQWTSAEDPDGVVYKLEIATDEGFDSIVCCDEELQFPAAAIDVNAALGDEKDRYHWRVVAIDGFGRRSVSAVRVFNTNRTNNFNTVLETLVHSDENHLQLQGVNVSFPGPLKPAFRLCDENDCMFKFSDASAATAGSVEVSVDAEQHDPKNFEVKLALYGTKEEALTLHYSDPSPKPIETNPGGVFDPDLNGDGWADMLFEQRKTKALRLWQMKGAVAEQQHKPSPISEGRWTIAGIADFDADEHAEVLLRDTGGKGRVSIQKIEGANVFPKVRLKNEPNPKWVVAGVGDFDGDKRADILWWHRGNRKLRIWYLGDGLTFDRARMIGKLPNAKWRVAGVADFDGDHWADVLLKHAGNRNLRVWQVKKQQISKFTLKGPAGKNWTVAGLGDFDGDDRGDVFWRDTVSGKNLIWFMRGGKRKLSQATQPMAKAWRVARTGDYDGADDNATRRADVLWRHDKSGRLEMWHMNGARRVTARAGVAPGANWVIR